MLMATQKLQHYFTDHEVLVVTSYPLGDIIRNREAAGRISKWALELMDHGIRYIPCTAIKSQALTDFVAEWTDVMSTGPIFREVAGKFDLWRSRRWRSGFKSDAIRTLQPLHHCSVGYQPSTT